MQEQLAARRAANERRAADVAAAAGQRRQLEEAREELQGRLQLAQGKVAALERCGSGAVSAKRAAQLAREAEAALEQVPCCSAPCGL